MVLGDAFEVSTQRQFASRSRFADANPPGGRRAHQASFALKEGDRRHGSSILPSTQNSPARNMGVQIGSLRSIHPSFTLQCGNICWFLPCPSICLQSTLFYILPTCSPLSSLDEDVVLGTRVGSYFRKRCLQPSRTAERAGQLCLSLLCLLVFIVLRVLRLVSAMETLATTSTGRYQCMTAMS